MKKSKKNFKHFLNIKFITYYIKIIIYIFLDDIKCLRFESWWIENGERN
jgi:hypothetical protein